MLYTIRKAYINTVGQEASPMGQESSESQQSVEARNIK